MLTVLTWLVRVVLAVLLLNALVVLVLAVGQSLEALAQKRRARLHDWDADYQRILDGRWR